MILIYSLLQWFYAVRMISYASKTHIASLRQSLLVFVSPRVQLQETMEATGRHGTTMWSQITWARTKPNAQIARSLLRPARKRTLFWLTLQHYNLAASCKIQTDKAEFIISIEPNTFYILVLTMLVHASSDSPSALFQPFFMFLDTAPSVHGFSIDSTDPCRVRCFLEALQNTFTHRLDRRRQNADT